MLPFTQFSYQLVFVCLNLADNSECVCVCGMSEHMYPGHTCPEARGEHQVSWSVAFALIEPEVRLADSKPRQSVPVSSLLSQMMEIRVCPWTMLIFTQT